MYIINCFTQLHNIEIKTNTCRKDVSNKSLRFIENMGKYTVILDKLTMTGDLNF